MNQTIISKGKEVYKMKNIYRYQITNTLIKRTNNMQFEGSRENFEKEMDFWKNNGYEIIEIK